VKGDSGCLIRAKLLHRRITAILSDRSRLASWLGNDTALCVPIAKHQLEPDAAV